MVNEEQFVGKAKSGNLAKKRGSGSQTVVYATNASKKEGNEWLIVHGSAAGKQLRC